MKKTLLIALVCFFFKGFSQLPTAASAENCGTQMPSNYLQFRNSVINSTQSLPSVLKHDLCVNKKFSIVFYVIADSTGALGVTPANLDTCVARLNRVFKRICVTFLNCSTVVIPNHPFNTWSKDTIEPVVVANWHTDKTINIYVPTTIVGENAGYAYFPGGKDVIVIEKTSITSQVVCAHEMGHFFGLPHTFAEIGTPVSPAHPLGTNTYEFVNRTNCYTNGDGFCDTEADCYPLNRVTGSPCEYLAGAKDGNNEYYVAPVDNLMTYFTCRCRFTQEQYNFMANVMLTVRKYLH